jgi:formylglycine-generating enzyme required for sulfatase activity
VPAPTLLRDALLLLESGEPLEEGHRTLLLRAALAHGRGIHTALKHQTDPERVGLVVAESLLDWQPPLHLEGPDIQAALGHPDVIAALIRELRRRLRESSPSGKTQVGALLGQLAQPVQHIPPSVSLDRRRDLHRPLRRTLFVGLIIATLAFFLVQYRTTHPAEMVLLPGGRYTSAPSSNLDRRVTVEVESIFVDRFEATNREYRACISRGACPWPTRSDSATHSAYLTNPAFADFPVVHVTLHAATAYCAWQGKRLPTAAEWMAAAGGAPTQQIHRFPWGEQFDPQRANSAETARGDTVPIGTFRPGGNSPIGASDLAGNVAEWTTTQSAAGVTHSVTNSVSGNTIENIIKGGSFADERTALQITTEQFFPADQSAPWLGFRCVRTARSPR